MLPIITSAQIKQIEQLSCEDQNIDSLQLMERAGQAFSLWLTTIYKKDKKNIHIFCGNGNNGGDGLVVARLLNISGYNCKVYLVDISKNSSNEYLSNLDRLRNYASVILITFNNSDIRDYKLASDDLIIDAILGSGVNKKIEENWIPLFEWINSLQNIKISLDLPSGLPCDSIVQGIAIHSDFTFGFEYPKFSYFLPEHSTFIKKWRTESIGLSNNLLTNFTSMKNYIERSDIKSLIKPRNSFSYKNNFGHLLVIAGSNSMCGAAILSASAAMRSGVGLTTVISEESCKNTIFQLFPEAMIQSYEDFFKLSFNRFSSIVIGPGMKGVESIDAILRKCLRSNLPIIIDAEAIQNIGSNHQLLSLIPVNTILTPHIGEFEKLVNKKFDNSIDRLEFASQFAKEYKLIIVLKGANTCIINSDGKQYFNSTGNQGMATAGSGDVLSGIIGSMLAQNYSPLQAALIAVYIHGLAGDYSLRKQSFESLIASDIIENLGSVFKDLHPNELF
ncbi:MAG: NAD(P)H-hydrate dehydratase [Saprospiraceae bacterium]|nr:NAD(P)H-hydrate dehydratase [Saprospiraceae bacterium]